MSYGLFKSDSLSISKGNYNGSLICIHCDGKDGSRVANGVKKLLAERGIESRVRQEDNYGMWEVWLDGAHRARVERLLGPLLK